MRPLDVCLFVHHTNLATDNKSKTICLQTSTFHRMLVDFLTVMKVLPAFRRHPNTTTTSSPTLPLLSSLTDDIIALKAFSAFTLSLARTQKFASFPLRVFRFPAVSIHYRLHQCCGTEFPSLKTVYLHAMASRLYNPSIFLVFVFLFSVSAAAVGRSSLTVFFFFKCGAVTVLF